MSSMIVIVTICSARTWTPVYCTSFTLTTTSFILQHCFVFVCLKQHQVAKEYHSRGPRINLTFRTIYPEPAGRRHGGQTLTTSTAPTLSTRHHQRLL